MTELGAEPEEDEIEDEFEALGGDVGAWPDLVLIDGGAGQLSAAQGVLAELGLHGLPVAGIAKGPDRNAGRERFFMPGKPAFSLPRTTRFSTSCSACATRRIASPSAPIGPSARRP